MTCKDCLHYDACLDNQVCGECEFVTNVDYEDMKEWCGSFQNKADFVEVVRCEKCKYGDVSTFSLTKDGQEEIASYCNLKNRVTDVDSYCPCGERK